MPSKEEILILLSSIGGAILGAYWAGVPGAGLGALFAWLIPFAAKQFSEGYRLKRRILEFLSSDGAKQVREIMREHGISIPIDCFDYDNSLPFVQALTKYRKAFRELELENKVVRSERAPVIDGYADPPNDWVNQWSGCAYQKSPAEHIE